MSTHQKEEDQKPSAYPQPSEADKQFQNQPEYTDQQPNDFHDKSISDVPVSDAAKQSNDPMRGSGKPA